MKLMGVGCGCSPTPQPPLFGDRGLLMNKSEQQGIRFDRVPPQDIDAERALLGAMIEPIGTPETIKKAMINGVVPEMFYKESHRDICTTIYNLYDKNIPVDLVTLAKELEDNDLLEKVRGVPYLDELLDSTPTSTNILYYASIVKEYALTRKAIDASVRLYNKLFDYGAYSESIVKQYSTELLNIKNFYGKGIEKKYGYTAKEIAEMDIPEPLWIVRNYIPEGLTLIAGAPKIGKSWMTLQLALATAQPKETGIFLGVLPLESSGDVLYLALEDSVRRIKSRLYKLCRDENFPPRLEVWTEIPKLEKGGLGRMEYWIESKQDPKLIVIDVFEKIRDRDISKYKSAYTEDYEDLGKIKELADRTGISIVVVEHRRKMQADDILDSISGSVGKQGAPDGLLIIRRARREKIGSLFRTGKDYDEDDEMAIQLDIDSGVGWSLIGEASEVNFTEQRKAIVELLESTNEPMNPKQIADELEMDGGYIRKTLRRLLKDETIKQFGYGKYIVNYAKK